jgi:hypothetical protein
MFFRMNRFEWELVLDLAAEMRMIKEEKDLEIMLLRQQLRIVKRKQPRGPHIPRWQKVPVPPKNLIQGIELGVHALKM